jgi:peptide deformylase
MQLVSKHDPILRNPTKPVDLDKIADLVPTFEEMYAVMRHDGGIGLAAPQVGLDINLFVMEWMGVKRTCINPVILEASEETSTENEGCLSFPHLNLPVTRPLWAVVGWFDETGTPRKDKLVGLEARVFLHEWDHCHGILFTDRVGKVTLHLAKAKADKKARRKK